ncbi:MAG: Crp/Fnr family transcriptional regulator [Acidobacteria bacterium]|nr:MAG: Crp/Fnr family transcriptional regulator [Acidobacteriota bacterium]
MPDRKVALGLAALLLILPGCANPGDGAKPTHAQSPVARTPSPPPSLLLFTKTAGFRHDSIPAGIAAVKMIADKHRIELTATEDPAVITDARLSAISAVIFLNTSGDLLNDEQQGALERFVRAGGGFAGIHAAADTEHDWPFYGELVGARFANHPPGIHRATVRVEDPLHPSTLGLPETWERIDEWYNFASNPRAGVHVLANLDESTYSGGSMGDHPIAWLHNVDAGRSWYTAGGHTQESYAEPAFLDHIEGGILWAAGLDSGQR